MLEETTRPQALVANQTVLGELGDTLPAAATANANAPRSHELPELQPGAVIGRYVVLSRLGAGAMGIVLAAYDPELDRKVALKLLKPRGEDTGHAQARLKREAQALAKLGHPNVVAVHDVGAHEGQLFVGMEFVEGQTLGEWIESSAEPRPWREVVKVLSEAGRGLAAAHEVGLIHRDFKPENVMLGDGGRVRVMDFGLARAEGEKEERSPMTPAALEISSSAPMLSLRLTRTGALMGTPAYMSLEQFMGAQVDARSDQFSFCVTLYEALYGERPFAQETLGQLLSAVEGGEVRPAPPRSAVPAWLRQVVLRGLSPAPDARWPSMNALLEALADDPAARRRAWLIAAAAAATLGGALWGGLVVLGADSRECAGMERHLAGVWDDDRRAAVEAAFLETSLAYAPGTWTRVEARLDDYTDAWTEARARACEATRRGEQSTALLDRRMGCFDERLLHARATIDVLTRADETVVKEAVEAVAGLPRLERCDDVDALLSTLPPPEDPETARRVAALDERLMTAEALEHAGKYKDGLELARAVVTEADALGYEPLRVRASLQRALLQEHVGEYAEAEATLAETYELAVAIGMNDEAARAIIDWMGLVGVQDARHQEGRQLERHARALARRVGADEATMARYLNVTGAMSMSEGDYERARGELERALAGLERAYDPAHPDVVNTINNLGVLERKAGRHQRARVYNERALALRRQTLDPDHPDVAGALDNLGLVLMEQGEYERAREHHERALAIRVKTVDPDHPHLGISYNNVGEAAQRQGDHARARRYYERALEVFEAALGPEHPNVAISRINLGSTAIFEDDPARARGEFERALRIIEKTLSKEHPFAGFALTGLGQALLGEGEPAQALPHLERALALRGAQEGSPAELAETRFALARALWEAPEGAGRDRPRALELSARARREFEAAGASSTTKLEEVTRWRARRVDAQPPS